MYNKRMIRKVDKGARRITQINQLILEGTDKSLVKAEKLKGKLRGEKCIEVMIHVAHAQRIREAK